MGLLGLLSKVASDASDSISGRSTSMPSWISPSASPPASPHRAPPAFSAASSAASPHAFMPPAGLVGILSPLPLQEEAVTKAATKAVCDTVTNTGTSTARTSSLPSAHGACDRTEEEAGAEGGAMSHDKDGPHGGEGGASVGGKTATEETSTVHLMD